MISNGMDHPGLLLMMYPRPVFVAAAVLDFFPIEGTHKTFREVQDLYSRFHHADRIGMTESYNGHQFSDQNQEAALEFMDRFNDLPAQRKLAPVVELEGKTLQSTRTGQSMLDFEDARSLMDVIKDYYLEHKSQKGKSIAQLYRAGGYSNVNAWAFISMMVKPRLSRSHGSRPEARSSKASLSIATFSITVAIWKCLSCIFTRKITTEKFCCGLAKTARRPPMIGPRL